jgi:hypothetical protein
VISAAIAAHDPLDPWLVQSNYDEHYWDDEAAAAVTAIGSARSEADVYEVIASVVKPLVRDPDADDYVRERLTASASAVWRYLVSRR